MSGPAFYKRDPRRALRGMAKLTLEQRGCYQTVQDLIYDAGGPIANDERFLAGQMLIGRRRFRALRDELAAMGRIHISDDGTKISDDVCIETLDRYHETREKMSDGGRRGGAKSRPPTTPREKKPEKNSEKTPSFSSVFPAAIDIEPLKNKALDEACLAKNLREERKEEERSSAPSGAEQRAGARAPPLENSATEISTPKPKPDPRPLDRCLAAAGPGLADPAKHGSLQLTAHRIAAAIAAGCDLELDLLPVIAARTAKARGNPIATWDYFDRPWADARDRRLAQFAAPDHTRFAGAPHGQTSQPASQRRGTGSYVDAALRALDRMERPSSDSRPEPGCLDGEGGDLRRAIAG